MGRYFFHLLTKRVIFLASLLLFSCLGGERKTESNDEPLRDLAAIMADGKLVAVTDFNATSYFIYKGEPMGYQYDMLRDLATFLGVKLELIAENDIEKSFEMLKKGEVDIIANSLAITAQRKNEVDFTIPHGETSQVLVQRVPSDGQPLMIEKPLQLAGKVVYVQRSSAAAQRLKNLSDEIGGGVTIVELPNHDADKLIELVATGEIDYVVCDESVARVKAVYYKNINIEIPIGFPQHTAWAVRKSSPELLKRINTWLEGYLKTAHYRNIENKYFSEERFNRRANNDYFYMYTGRVSQWDEFFKRYSQNIDWDWRLLASLVYQESRFRHDVTSHRGASGLMQMMPQTAEYFGVDSTVSPNKQIEAGVKYLKWIDKRFEGYNIPREERIKFVLASYNAGIGHVIDARNLAIKYGRNPNVWENNVEYFIRNKSEYLNDTIVKYGRLKGSETYRYVKEIIERYEHYKNIVGE